MRPDDLTPDCGDCRLTIELPDGSVSDACTGFPNGPWVDCCMQHDLAYRQACDRGWFAGWRARRAADIALLRCVWKTGHRLVAVAMFLGVRALGWWAWHLHHRRSPR